MCSSCGGSHPSLPVSLWSKHSAHWELTAALLLLQATQGVSCSRSASPVCPSCCSTSSTRSQSAASWRGTPSPQTSTVSAPFMSFNTVSSLIKQGFHKKKGGVYLLGPARAAGTVGGSQGGLTVRVWDYRSLRNVCTNPAPSFKRFIT